MKPIPETERTAVVEVDDDDQGPVSDEEFWDVANLRRKKFHDFNVRDITPEETQRVAAEKMAYLKSLTKRFHGSN